MKNPLVLLAGATLLLTACDTFFGPPPPPPPPRNPAAPLGTAALTTGTKAPFGTYVTDGSGRSVYILEGTRGMSGLNRCSGPCLSVWPMVPSGAATTTAGGLDPRQLRPVSGYGGTQDSYGGWPLYYYHHDMRPGDTTGQHVTDSWGTWHLISPSGEPIRPRGGY